MAGNQLFLAAVSVAELRYGALVAGWGDPRRARLEDSIGATTVVPVTDRLLTRVAELRLTCRGPVTHSTIAPTPVICGSPHQRSILALRY
jgi:predicted nucleic acid-binding protein